MFTKTYSIMLPKYLRLVTYYSMPNVNCCKDAKAFRKYNTLKGHLCLSSLLGMFFKKKHIFKGPKAIKYI